MACDLCNGTEHEILWDKAKRETQGKLKGVIIPGHIHSRNVICKTCGLVYVEPKMSKAELAKFYSEDYRTIYNGKHSLEAEKRHANNAFDILIGLGDLPHGYTLDIGCSTGELIELINLFAETRNGNRNRACGIEPNAEYCEKARSKGLQVENCGIENYNPGIKFDIITMLNALEHVHSPTEVLTKINSLLNDDGYVLISVPNLYNKTIHLPTDVFLSNAHLYNFTPTTLKAYFNKCGFEVVQTYGLVEEMGEKIYLLGRKAKVDWTMPVATDELIRSTRVHLEQMDLVFKLKQAITGAGFK